MQNAKCRMRLLAEKIPLFALAALASVMTFLVQRHAGAVMGVESVPLGLRVGNTLISYGRYLGKLVWPMDLAVLYPYPGQWPLGKVTLAGGLLLGLSVLAWVQRRRHPYLLIGWLWFLGMLVPVIGLVQVGEQAMADRYTYLPSLGVLVFAVWGTYELTRSWRYQVVALSVAGGAAIVLCFALTRQQLGYWRDSEALFQHALQVTENNDVAHNSLGVALGRKGQTDEAIRQFQEAIRLKSDRPAPHFNLGVAFAKEGQTDEAVRQYHEAIRLKPDYANAHNSLGNALARKGQTDEAIRQFQEAIRLRPDQSNAYYNLGLALDKKGRTDEAIQQYQKAIRLRPDDAETHKNLGNALATKGQTDEAVQQYQEVIRLKPDDAQTHNNLGYALLTRGQPEEAIRQYREALRLKPDFAAARNNLQHALATKSDSLQPAGNATNR
jgi:protein O-mannosyl-transferase